MTKHVDSADERARLSTLVDEIARDGAPIVIERDGKPVAALVTMEQFERVAVDEYPSGRGVLDLLGLWGDVGDDVIDALVEDIYAERERDYGRPVDLTS